MELCPAHMRSHIRHVFSCVNVCAHRRALTYVRVQLCALTCRCTHLPVRTCVHSCALTGTCLYSLRSLTLALHMLAATSRHAPMRVHACFPLCTRLHPRSPRALALKRAHSHRSIPGVSSRHPCARTPPRAPAHPRAHLRSRSHLRARAPSRHWCRPAAAAGPALPRRSLRAEEGTGHHRAPPCRAAVSQGTPEDAQQQQHGDIPPGLPQKLWQLCPVRLSGKTLYPLSKYCDPLRASQGKGPGTDSA